MTAEKPKKKMGRPFNLEKTKQIRVPVSLIPAINNMMAAYKMQPAQQPTTTA
jgi:hypothetical protein